jgi:tetratricopeptide (TPR) repeat protein
VSGGELLKLAQQHQQAGRLAEAEAIYRRILAADPRNADALHGLGWLAHQAGRPDVALPLLQQALSSGSKDAQWYLHLALVNGRLGKSKEAEAAYRRACDLRPRDPALLNEWGVYLMSQRRRDEGIALFQRAINADPQYTPSYRHLGLAYDEQSKRGEAEATFREWIRLEPRSIDALVHLGRAFGGAGRFDDAIDCLRQALRIDPSDADANYYLGVALRKQRRYPEALEPLQRAATARPDQHFMLRELAANHADLGDHTLALTLFDRVLAMQPDDVEAHGHRARSLLFLGKLAEGWKEYEWRWKSHTFPHNRRHTHIPQWTGFDIAGKTILLHAEQGFGDNFQFVRYVPLVAGRGARVLLQCHSDAMAVLRTVEGVSEFFDYEQLVPKPDVQCPLMSLPFAFGTTLQTIPNRVPYLHADADKIEQWKPRLAAPVGVRKIGLFWRGKTNSFPPALLAPLAKVPNARFFSLQKGKPSDEAPDGLEIVRFDADLKDFPDTAAVISLLDLIISIDTSIAHLAGALAKPVWTLLDARGEFRWMLDREDCPWYPTMRLFRQKQPGDWAELIDRVAAELHRRNEAAS